MTKIAYVQMEVIPCQPEVNTKKMLDFISQAKKQYAEMIIFPEMAISGKYIGNAINEKSFLRECISCGEKIIAASEDLVIVFGNVDLQGKSKYYLAHQQKLGYEGDCNEYITMTYKDEFDMDDRFSIRISADPFSIDCKAKRDKIFSGKARERKSAVIFVNSVGIQNSGKTIYTLDGTSTVYNPKGEIIQQAKSFEEIMQIIEIEGFGLMPEEKIPEVAEIEQIYNALNFGVEKFLQQIEMKKVVIGISGGIDSAVAAALYTKILGPENVYLVNMPSVFNSATTKGLSEQLAKNLGCKYCVVPIQESVDFTVNQLENTSIRFLEKNLNENIKISSFVKENIQARDRSGRILAAISAAIGGGFTCNANKAETTVGYATLYGDEAGFLCALADLWKFQIYDLANYLNEKIYKREVIPQGIIDIVPSAELSNAQNVDEGKGDPLKYPYHDYLFRAFVEKSLTPEDILKFYSDDTLEKEIGCKEGLVKEYFATAKDFIKDLERWWKLYKGMAVAKRIQSPPIMALTSRAFGSFKENQNTPYFTKNYKNLKEKIINA